MRTVNLTTSFGDLEPAIGGVVEVAGILVSVAYAEVWVVGRDDDIAQGRGVRLIDPLLMERLTEDVPPLGGGRRYYYPCRVTGTLVRTDLRPGYELHSLGVLIAEARIATYRTRFDTPFEQPGT